MTSQANAYYANRIRERELQEVSIPKQRLAERTFAELELPQFAETKRANLANEDIKRKEYEEHVRSKNLDEAFRRDTTLTSVQELGLRNDANMATVTKGGNPLSLAMYGSYKAGKTIADTLAGDTTPERADPRFLEGSVRGATRYVGYKDTTYDPSARIHTQDLGEVAKRFK